MEMLSQSSLDESCYNTNSTSTLHDDGTSWLESLEAFEEPEDDFFKIGDYPLKRRQKRQRLLSLHCYVARSGAVAVAASASMFAQQVENMARVEGNTHVNCNQDNTHGPGGIGTAFSGILANFKSSLGCTLGSAAARVGELYTSLANAIGEPPQRGVLSRGREEQDAPLLLLWAINLCALCTIAALFLVVVAFCTGADPNDNSSEAELVDQMQPAPLLVNNNNIGTEMNAAAVEKRNMKGIFRVLGVVSLSLVSGGGLGLRHPLQSALLCGS